MAGLLLSLRRQISMNHRKNPNAMNKQHMTSPKKRPDAEQRSIGQSKSKEQGIEPMYDANSQNQMNMYQQEAPEQRPYGISPYAEFDTPKQKTVTDTTPADDPYAPYVQSTMGQSVTDSVVPSVDKQEEAFRRDLHTPEAEASEGMVSAHKATVYTENRMEKPVVPVSQEEDTLLAQIDEFRERAKQLRSMMSQRENQAEELQSLVNERKEQADSLGQIVQERQEQVNQVSAQVEKQMDVLIERIGTRMDEMEQSLRQSVGHRLHEEAEENRRVSAEQGVKMTESLQQMTEKISAVGEAMSSIKDEFPAVKDELEATKNELAEKVHTENVKCYRNLQDLFKTMDGKIDRMESVPQKVKSVKRSAVFAVILGLLNLVAIAGIYLLQLGIISF